MNATNKYKIKAFNDEICICDVCGKSELKGTYVMLDLETNEEFRAGSTCGSKIAKWTNKEFTNKVKQLNEENLLLAINEFKNSIEYINNNKDLEESYFFEYEERKAYIKNSTELLRLKKIEIKNKYNVLF